MSIHVLPTRAENHPSTDDYVVWTTMVDAAIMRGRRSQVERFLFRLGWVRVTIDAAFRRADEYGSSASPQGVGWKTPLIVMGEEPTGMLPRDLVRPYCDALFRRVLTKRGKEKRLATLQALLEPFDED
jgi:hypothetical protein